MADRSRSLGGFHELSVCRSVALSLCLITRVVAGQVPLTDENAFRRSDAVISPPIIVGASNCVGSTIWDVAIRGGNPSNGTYDVFFGSPINGIPMDRVATAAVAAAGPTFVRVDLTRFSPFIVRLSDYYFVAQESRQIQSYPPGTMITVRGPESEPHALRDPSSLAAPFIAPTPLFECGGATAIGGHLPGDSLRLMSGATNVRFAIPRAFSTYDFVGEVSPAFKNGEKLFAQYSTCSGAQTSPPSKLETVVPFPLAKLPQVSTPRVGAVGGVTQIPYRGVTNGATLRAIMTRSGYPIETLRRVCVGGETCAISAPKSWGTFAPGDDLRVTQELCDGSQSADTRWQVTSCYSQSPLLEQFPTAGSPQLTFSEFALSAWLLVFACTPDKNGDCIGSWIQVGSGYDVPTVQLTRPLRSGERLAVSQQIGDACPPLHATGYIVR